MATLWSEQSFRAYVAGRCKELGIEIRQALAAAGLTHDAYYKTPAASRRIEDVLKIAGALRVSPAQIFGCDLTGDVSLDLLRQAFGTARLMFSRLPGLGHKLTKTSSRQWPKFIMPALCVGARGARLTPKP